jgi:hypothetical protein
MVPQFELELFLLFEAGGVAGLSLKSERLLHLTREASLPHRAARPDFRGYKLAARIAV